MEETVFEFDFGDDLEIPVEVEDTPEVIVNDVDPVEQTEESDVEEEQPIIENEDESEEIEDVETHQLFIEGWKESGFLVLPEGYDYAGKTVKQVMNDSAKYFNDAIKEHFVESLPEDIKEAARLAIEGKISNAKEYLSYQVEADKTINGEAIKTVEDARRYLETYYKENTDLDAEDIEQTLDRLELNDKLLDKATSIKAKRDESRKQEIEARKQELLQKEAEAKANKEREMKERINKVKTYIDKAAWTAEHKKYVQEEISQGMKNTVSNIQAAITDPDVTPEFVSLMSRLLTKDSNGKISISKDALKEFASTKVAKEIKSSWESKLDKSNLPKTAGKSSKRENSNEVIYDLFDFEN